MGHYWNTNTGYGVLVLADENEYEEEEGFDVDIESELLDFAVVGDSVIGGGNGLFFMTEDVAIQMNSVDKNNYISEFVEEYKDYVITCSILLNHVNSVANDLKDKGFVVRVGAFKVSDFG